jgi:L-methionine (R)-S-oxide reductase
LVLAKVFAGVVIVDDVDKFDGHIACSTEAKSEIVLPVFDKQGEVKMVLDIDSEKLAHFNTTDEQWLKKLVIVIEKIINT